MGTHLKPGAVGLVLLFVTVLGVAPRILIEILVRTLPADNRRFGLC